MFKLLSCIGIRTTQNAIAFASIMKTFLPPLDPWAKTRYSLLPLFSNKHACFNDSHFNLK